MKQLVSIIAVVLLTAPSISAQGVWKLDRSHTSIGFMVTHMLISEVPGSFSDFDIMFASSEEDFADATITATIRTASIDTDNDRRDGHLRSDDFFNAEQYPNITFVSSVFEKTGEKTYKIHGMLTIRDVTRPVIFDGTLLGMLDTKRGTLSGWKASLTINRFDYDIKWNRALETGGLVVSENVEIMINAKFLKPTEAGG